MASVFGLLLSASALQIPPFRHQQIQNLCSLNKFPSSNSLSLLTSAVHRNVCLMCVFYACHVIHVHMYMYMHVNV